MNQSVSATLHEVYGEELNDLLDLLLASETVTNWADIERRLVRSVAALILLHDLHRPDERGRCSVCWLVPRHWWCPWPRRSTCTVHSALGSTCTNPSVLYSRPLPTHPVFEVCREPDLHSAACRACGGAGERARKLTVINPEPDNATGTGDTNTAATRALSALVDTADALSRTRDAPPGASCACDTLSVDWPR